MNINSKMKRFALITTLSLAITGCSNKDNVDNNNTVNIEQTQSGSDLPNYRIALIDDVNIGKIIIRKTLHIVVEDEYTLEQLYDIAQKEALAYASKNKVNALAIGFYKNEDNVGNGYEMGRVEYAPYGDWSKAIEVNAGDYSNFEFANYLGE